MRKRGIIMCLLLVFSATNTWAQFDNVGTSAANFLKIGVGSRAEAMGGAFVAQANDITSLYWNVAGLARMEKSEIGIARTDWILDINHVFVGGALKLGDFGTLGASVFALTMGEFDHTTAREPTGTGLTFDASNLAIGLAFARSLTDRFSIGVQAKYIQEKISSMSANTIALDLGTQYVTSFRGLTIGMAISNFGSNMRLSGREQLIRVDADETVGSNPNITPARLETESWPLPLTFRLGISMNFMEGESNRLTGNIDYDDPRDLNPKTAFGVEYGFKEMVFIRGGFTTSLTAYGLFDNEKLNSLDADQEESFLTFGGGVNLKSGTLSLRLDYAYNDLGRLTEAHRFTFIFGF